MKDFTNLIQPALQQYKKELFIEAIDVSSPTITTIGNGENHHMIKVSVGKNTFVFRIPHRPELVPKLKAEFQILETIPKDIGPIPLIFNEDRDATYMIQTFVTGNQPTIWTQRLVQEHVDQMARLHSCSRTAIEGFDIVKLFEEKINFRKTHDPQVLEDVKISGLIDTLIAKIKTIASAFMDHKEIGFVHGDLHTGNILVDKHSVRYVDWEEAGMGDPALDLAGLLLSPLVDIDIDSYLAYYQKQTSEDKDLRVRVFTWLLFKDLSLLLHKKWESLDAEGRAIQKTDRTYEVILDEIMNRIRERLNQLHV